jgi:perosamine synthetase
LDPSTGLTAKKVMDQLNEHGIGTRPFFYPIHKQPVLIERGLFSNDTHLNAEHISKYGFYLPSGLGLSRDEIVRSANTLLKILD